MVFYDCRKKQHISNEKQVKLSILSMVADNACYVFMECRFDF
jgi:hypothetical protein